MPSVLVVDDDAGIREICQDVFEAEGYEVRTAENGLLALQAIRAESPNVVVLDLMMPVMNGWEFVEACRAESLCEGTPVVVVSAAVDLHGVAEQLRTRGVRAVLAKPFDVEALIGVVERFVPPS